MLALLLSLILVSANAQDAETVDPEATTTAIVPKTKPFAEVMFYTNNIERGLTRTQGGFAMQSAFGYQFGEAQLGIWGTNVRFASNDEHFNHRYFFNYRIVLSPTFEFALRYDLSQYTLNNSRNGSKFNIGIGVYTYHFELERVDNMLGEGTSRTSLIAYKAFYLPFSLEWRLGVAYNMMSGNGYSAYFDANTALAYKVSELEFAVNASFNSGASQFSGDGDLAIYLSAGTKF